ncbi:hypothetical protein [Acinetobacter sp.]|uniref:hypothetical protein n=1 Tax=Acinetobacter sp. TaxID=472 RepID=UPI002823248D|nr:hypothetical protein [Acinetobacter sp.]MDR0238144.1 hypothetical protein [Acinetobacter sp.]
MGETKSEIIYEIEFGKSFNKYYPNFPKLTADKVDDFIEHYEKNGLKGWIGKIAKSDRIPLDVPNRDELVKKARYYNLWHVHIGDPVWKNSSENGIYVSNWVIHFQKIGRYKIKLLELDSHKPMTLPNDNLLNE